MPDTPVVCCILGVCCAPEAQWQALAKQLEGWDANTDEKSWPSHLAAELLAHYDLVPKGAGQGILDAYRPYFKHQP